MKKKSKLATLSLQSEKITQLALEKVNGGNLQPWTHPCWCLISQNTTGTESSKN